MTIVRRRDGRTGWAFQMVIPLTFNGWMFPSGSYIVECMGWRTAMTADSFNAHFKPL